MLERLKRILPLGYRANVALGTVDSNSRDYMVRCNHVRSLEAVGVEVDSEVLVRDGRSAHGMALVADAKQKHVHLEVLRRGFILRIPA